MIVEKAFEVRSNEKVGRYVVAARDLEAGEEFLVETPVIVGPKHHTPLLCLGCMARTTGETLCSRCSWPVCGPECEDLPMHKDAECAVFSAANVKFGTVPHDHTDDCPQLECIAPLRLLLTIGTERWKNEVSKMESHCALRKNTADWQADQVNIVNFLRGPCKLAGKYTEEQIHQACGILAVNSFEARSFVSGGNPVRVIYPQLALLSHSCVPNTSHSVGSDYKCRVRTTVAVKKDDELFSTYTHILLPTYARREHLKLSKYFDCQCVRCADPYELGANISTMKCPQCEWGWVVAEQPLEPTTDWKCDKCGYMMPHSETLRALNKIRASVESVQPDQIEIRERMIKMYHGYLHPNHGYLVTLKHALSQLYGRVDEYTFDEMPDLLMERKIELCRQMLRVADIVEPGFSRLRGILLYELHAPLIMLARSLYQQDVLTGLALYTRMQEAEKVLREALQILSLEDPESMEGQLATQASVSLQQLRETIIMLPQQINIVDDDEHRGG